VAGGDVITSQTGARPASYKWVALSNTTLGFLMATINSSIVLISLPAIFRGIGLDPLTPANIGYLLWMLMGYMVVTAVLVVSLGRIGDMYGRVRMYTLGFAVFTVASIGLSLVFWQGATAAITLIVLRVVQGVGGALLMANSAAILTDAFPENQRGMALGINSVSGIAGSFIGLIVGGLLSTLDWHLVFIVSVPVGAAGTIWAMLRLRELGTVSRARMDWLGNATFGIGLILILVGITYGIQPYATSSMGWTNPTVLAELAVGVALLVAFVVVETRVAEPMIRVGLFQVPAFAAGNLAGLLAAVGRGGLMFMLIIWLQGIWLPLHGLPYDQTPLWAAIAMLPMTAGFLIAGPISGYLSDRFGARPFATGGMVAAAATFGLLLLLPADFSYLPFAALLLCNGLAMGLFSSPNTAGIMNSVPPEHRGVASGVRATFQNSGMNLSIGLFFSLMIAGLSSSLPSTLLRGLAAQGVPLAEAQRISHLSPVSTLFAAFLGYNPMQELLGPVLSQLRPDQAAYLTGRSFFPNLIAQPFLDGLHLTFTFSLAMMLVAAAASWLRGGRYVYRAEEGAPEAAPGAAGPPVVALSGAFGSGASEVGRRLAERLGVPFIDRALPADTAQRLAEPLREALAREDGGPQDGFGRVLAELAFASPLFGVTGPPSEAGPWNEERFRARLESALKELAAARGCVIVGHGSAAALRAEPRALRVRLDGSKEGRIAAAMRSLHLDEKAARSALCATDDARRAYLQRLYGVEPSDPTLYHLVIDSTAFTPDAVVDLILDGLRQRRASAAGAGGGSGA
jgi:MFS family permease